MTTFRGPDCEQIWWRVHTGLARIDENTARIANEIELADQRNLAATAIAHGLSPEAAHFGPLPERKLRLAVKVFGSDVISALVGSDIAQNDGPEVVLDNSVRRSATVSIGCAYGSSEGLRNAAERLRAMADELKVYEDAGWIVTSAYDLDEHETFFTITKTGSDRHATVVEFEQLRGTAIPWGR